MELQRKDEDMGVSEREARVGEAEVERLKEALRIESRVRLGLQLALAYLAESKSWSGDPTTHDAVLHGHDTPYELARRALQPEGGGQEPICDCHDNGVWIHGEPGELGQRRSRDCPIHGDKDARVTGEDLALLRAYVRLAKDGDESRLADSAVYTQIAGAVERVIDPPTQSHAALEINEEERAA